MTHSKTQKLNFCFKTFGSSYRWLPNFFPEPLQTRDNIFGQSSPHEQSRPTGVGRLISAVSAVPQKIKTSWKQEISKIQNEIQRRNSIAGVFFFIILLCNDNGFCSLGLHEVTLIWVDWQSQRCQPVTYYFHIFVCITTQKFYDTQYPCLENLLLYKVIGNVRREAEGRRVVF